MKSPLAFMKEKFGDKTKLVAAVEKFTSEDLWVAKTNKSKGLAHVSNAKLLRLHDIFAAVKEKFGTRAGLIDAIVELEKRGKDEGFRAHLMNFPVPRLFDLYQSTAKRKEHATKGSAPRKKKVVAPARPVAPKKAAAKKPATKKKK